MWTPLRLQRALVLAKIMDEGLLYHGSVDASISATDDYGPSRCTWRLPFSMKTIRSLDGLAYRSRHNNGEICFALFDRVLPTDVVEMLKRFFEERFDRADHLRRVHGAVFDSTPAIR